MKLQKFRWSKVYESQEEELNELLEAQGITAERWHADEFHIFDERTYEHDTTLWCAEGSFKITAGNKTFSMQPGDGITVPAGTTTTAVAGMSGCACYEATT